MKILVLGCNGMAGHMISLVLKEDGHEVIGFAREDLKIVDTIIGDAKKIGELQKIVLSGNYDAIVNCIGLLNKKANEYKADAVLLNSFLPHYLVDLTENIHTRVIHISTDCVFSGAKGGYKEEDLCDGTTFYDKSKALGEIDDKKNITIRTSIVGPDIKKDGIGLFNWFMQVTGKIQGYDKVYWTGQTTLQLAKTIEAVLNDKNAVGLYNLVPSEKISKYCLLKLFNKYMRNEEIEIVKNGNIESDKSLVRTKFDFEYKIPNYDDMVKELLLWMENHKELYSHYVQSMNWRK